MSDINTVKAQIQSLIDLANTTTGNNDTNLTDGVNALVGGFGRGGSGGSVFETSAQGIKPTVIVGTAITDMLLGFETSASIYVEEE